MQGEKELSGTATSVTFTNPDGSLALAVRNQNGPSTERVMTAVSAKALAQRGIDEIKVKVLPGRDGSPLGFLKTVIMPDGRVIQISAGSPND